MSGPGQNNLKFKDPQNRVVEYNLKYIRPLPYCHYQEHFLS